MSIPSTKQILYSKYCLIVKGKFTEETETMKKVKAVSIRALLEAHSLAVCSYGQVAIEHDPIIPSHSHDAVYTALPLTASGEH